MNKFNFTIQYSVALMVILITLSLALWLFSFMGIMNERDRIVDTTIALRNLESRETSSTSLGNLLRSTKNEQSKISSYFIANDIVNEDYGTVIFLENLEKLATDLGLKAVVDEVDAIDDGDNKILNLILSTEGSFASTYHYINLIELLPFSVSIGDVNLIFKAGSEKEKNLWTSSIKLVVNSYTSN